MRFLVLGGTGQVGTELLALGSSSGIEMVAPDRSQVDLQDARQIADIVAAEPWSAVINAAGYTEVDRAENEEAAAFALNSEAPARLAAEAGRQGIPFVHISTDYVFDGKKGSPYVERDAVAPLNAYGRSKLAGEVGVRAASPRHIILRTSWVYSPFRKNFVKTILRFASERDRLTIVADQRGCPTAANDIASACVDIATRCASVPGNVPYGTYHFAGAGDTTWFEFASAIVDMSGLRHTRKIDVVPIRTVDYPTPAARPTDTRLNSTAIAATFNIRPRPWREALRETIASLPKVEAT